MFKNISPKKLHSDAVKAYQEKNFRLASELFGQIANLVPSDPEAKYNHGVALQSAGLFGDAVKAFLLTIKLQPLNAAAHNNLGNAYKSLKRPDDAEAAYKKAIKIDATKPEAVNNLGLLMQNRGNFSEAEVLFRECLNIIPNEPSVLTNLGNVLRDRGRFVEAISVYNEVLTKNKNNVLILKNLAIALLNNGQNDIFIFLISIAALTDFLDGYLARKYNHISVFGAKLDPLADKVLMIGPLIWLVHENLVPPWTIWLIISRELLITSWRSDKSSGGAASIQGKYKTTLQFMSVILLLWPQNWGSAYIIANINKVGLISFWICLFLTFSSAIKYIFNEKESHQN